MHLWAFLGIAVLVILTPGPDTVMVTKNALIHGRRAALGTSLGVNTGLTIWTITAAVGVAAVVRASEVAFTTLKLIGAVYLIWLGVQAFRAAHERAGIDTTAARHGPPAGLGVGFRQGLFSNLANPKIAVFFTSLLPQFIDAHHPVVLPFLLLGGLFVLLTVVWLSGYALMAVEFGSVLGRPSVKAALDRLTGVVLIGLGIRLAFERR